VQPYWADKNWLNNVSENVSLQLPQIDSRPRSKYGVRSGTPEYEQRYYADPQNKTRQRERSRNYSARRRSELRTATVSIKQTLEDPQADKSTIQEMLSRIASEIHQEKLKKLPTSLAELRAQVLGTDGRKLDVDDRSTATTTTPTLHPEPDDEPDSEE
jgi:ribosomal protein S20